MLFEAFSLDNINLETERASLVWVYPGGERKVQTMNGSVFSLECYCVLEAAQALPS